MLWINNCEGPVELRKSCLSSSRSRLLGLLRHIYFGRIEDLLISNGEPVFDPPPRVVREVNFGKGHMLKARPVSDDFALKQEVQDLLAQLDGIGNGTVTRLEIRHGLPFRMHIEDSFEPSETEESS